EQGKDLLMKALSHLSTQLTVYSDLISTDTENVKKVPPDSRIRVQLLPFGDGLKAELFTKPFGEIPPYCKPGWGGKALISSQKGEQWQTVRNLKLEEEQANVIYSEIQQLESLEINDGLITFNNPLDSLYLLDILQKHQDIAIVEWPEGEKYRIKKQVDFGNFQLKVTTSTDWFELQGELKVDEETVLSIGQLLALTRKGHNNFVELSNGDFLVLSEKLRKRLKELDSFAQETKKGIQLSKFAAFSASDFFDEFEHLKTDKAWKDFKKKIEQADQIETTIPSNLQAELRPYQEEGFHWMVKLSEWGAGACLADDMGLGKTVQALTVLLHRSPLGPAMVICPVSVLPNWISETCKFAPSLNIKTLSPNNREKTIQSLEAGDLLITSYGLLQSEDKLFSDVIWASLVLDEAHTIKNYTTKTSKAAMLLQASFKLALTGTPIQNHLGEIWNLFNFINPGLLGSLQHFTDNFVKQETDTTRKHLKKLITPFILRRTKTAVLDELPPKTEIIKKIQLSNEEAAFYEALRRQALLSLEQDTGDSNGTKHLKALVEITRLRQACCNPAIVNQDINIPSSKLAAFIEIATDLRDNKHRALVFSQFVTHLFLVKKELDRQNITYQYLDGSTPSTEREKIVKRFQSGESDLFLISLKAGGLGLNLTAADFVIHLDPWWNPAVEDQASDRAHRIGQTRPVTVYRLVTENTIEEKIIQLHNTKRNLADSLLEGSDQSGKLSIKELMQLIKGEEGEAPIEQGNDNKTLN
ncbi:RNA polymerase-associated protein RapA, partial [termite gut metagenome]